MDQAEPLVRARVNPWRVLRGRPHLTLEWDDLPAGVGAMWAGDRIVLDNSLSQRDRRAALMHELVHEERGIGFPQATPAQMEKEEETVRRETAARLVPLPELDEFVRRRVTVEPVTASCIADEFDVPVHVAVAAVGNWARARL